MANFSTEFPIDSKNSVDDVVRLACGWIAGSPHTRVQKADLPQVPVDGEVAYSVDNEQILIASVSEGDQQIGGLRYVRVDDGLEWTTSIVALRQGDRHLLSLQVLCEALSTAARLPPPKKPYFIRQAITELGGGMDGEIPVADRPFRLGVDEASIAAALMLGTANNTLPIAYVSADYEGGYLVDPDELAKYVSGMAHVIVEPNRSFSFKVKELTEARNVFGGTIGVYWPESSARSVYFIEDETPDSKSIQVKISRDIRIALANRRQRTNCTWSQLKEAVARKRYEQLKLVGSTGLQEYVTAFDEELSAKTTRLQEAEQEIDRLHAELRRCSSANKAAVSELVRRGVEQDLYEHEIPDIVANALQDARRMCREGSRRQHVLDDLIAVNVPLGAGKAVEARIKALLKTYRDMGTQTRNELIRLGFEVSDDGKHYKAVFQGDGRYTFSFPKTSGDHRAGKNLSSDINNTLF